MTELEPGRGNRLWSRRYCMLYTACCSQTVVEIDAGDEAGAKLFEERSRGKPISQAKTGIPSYDLHPSWRSKRS
ncbi:unnamed protein product [Toxocara canis]|uniref:Transposase n=1 Tax=Toxocara canis TaxID=6265 RepID=A0A183VDV7_TOXCA|nr:unnamed protein product [Toxocara canis]